MQPPVAVHPDRNRPNQPMAAVSSAADFDITYQQLGVRTVTAQSQVEC